METNIIIRPHGKMYIIGMIIIYAFFIGLLSSSIFFILDKCYWALVFEILPIVFLIWITKEVVNYRLRLTDTKIYVTAQREWSKMRHVNLEIEYKDVKSIQHFLGLRPDRNKFTFASIIKLNYANKEFKYLDVSSFSEKQVSAIMDYVVKFAEQYNGYPIEVLPNSEVFWSSEGQE